MLSLRSIYAGGERKAYRRFCALRWPETNGSPVCPRCGCLESYNLKARRRFKCAACSYQFSATSGTIFASHKLSFVDLLGAIYLFVNASKGLSAVQLSRDLDVQYKTAFVLMHKLREAMAHETAEARLAGGVVIVLRQRGGRTLTRSFLREAEGVDFANARVEPGSILSADEVAHWDLLASGFELKRVNHSEAYSENGVNTNLAESYFSRLRRTIRGQHHAVSGKYLSAYSAHAAWLEDHGRESTGVLADRLILDALVAPISRTWSGYWQRSAA